MNKKIVIILLVVLVIILIVGFFVFFNSQEVRAPADNESEKVEEPNIEIDAPEVKIENPAPQGVLYVCQDKCGDGVCQPSGTVCKDQLSCICAETKQDCPQDCK